MKIGVFDSGVGGLSVVKAIELALPEYEVIFANDTKNVPYGTKSPAELIKLVEPILQELVAADCKVIVVACNTVSTTLITELREVIKVPLVAMEPMIKPAALATKSKVVAVCATPTTLASARYDSLKARYAHSITVLEPDCSDWALMIENNSVDRAAVQKLVNLACEEGADVIVLGCTHYHWIQDIINQAARGRAIVMQPEQPVIEQLKRVIAQLT